MKKKFFDQKSRSSIFSNHGSVVPVYRYTKMLKETENKETRLFCQIFVIGGILLEGARAPWATPLGHPLCL